MRDSDSIVDDILIASKSNKMTLNNFGPCLAIIVGLKSDSLKSVVTTSAVEPKWSPTHLFEICETSRPRRTATLSKTLLMTKHVIQLNNPYVEQPTDRLTSRLPHGRHRRLLPGVRSFQCYPVEK